MNSLKRSVRQACVLAGLLSAPFFPGQLEAQDGASAALSIPPLPVPPPPAESGVLAVATVKGENNKAAVSTLEPDEIEGFNGYPAPMQRLITDALALTKLNLAYKFGSADPKSGGMDCSGTIYHLLKSLGVDDIPRQSNEVCEWSMRTSILYRTEHVGTLADQAFSALKPGDLLFWTGTYETSSPREVPVTHVMIYLGKRREGGKPVVFGASDGRTFDGARRNGVSVFDFPLPRPGSKAEFYGYAPLSRQAWDTISKKMKQ